MLRSALVKATRVAKPVLSNASVKQIPALSRFYSSPTVTSPSSVESHTQDMIDQLKAIRSTPVCGYETRRLYQLVHSTDSVPEPGLVAEFLRSARSCNDFALAVRILESVKRKCGGDVKVLWPYITQELRPTLDELGVPLPEEIGYDKPELFLEDVFDIH